MLRAARRAVTLALALALCMVRYWAMRLRGPLTLERRARWLHGASASVLSSLGVRIRVEGTAPARGLVVSNHLSYLDIVLFSAAAPCFFVAKSEIENWPYFGKAARAGGTLFLERRSLASVARVRSEMTRRLALAIPLLLFPEGTSTDGSSVARFHTGLFEPAVRASVPVTPAAVRYRLVAGGSERDLCWFGDESFLPHLWKTLGARAFTAEVRFGVPRLYSNRRDAALETHRAVVAMRAEDQGEPPLS